VTFQNLGRGMGLPHIPLGGVRCLIMIATGGEDVDEES
jgi:hypothetical protein